MAKKINITAQLNAATTDGILADAGQIFDTKKGKFQEQVNEELEDAVKDIGVSFGNPSEVEVEVEKVDGTSSSVSIPAATTMAAGVMSAEDKVKLDESVAVANKASKDVAAQKATIDSLEEQLANIGDVGVASAAKDVTFTTGTSGLTQVNVQGALTELAGKVSSTVKDVRVRWNENGEVVIDSEEEGGDINSATIPAASQSADGVMSKEDKKKLDEIAESIVQEPGDSETLVMSQKAITDLYNKG